VIEIDLGMIELLVLSTAFKAAVSAISGELGSIPRRSRNTPVGYQSGNVI